VWINNVTLENICVYNGHINNFNLKLYILLLNVLRMKAVAQVL